MKNENILVWPDVPHETRLKEQASEKRQTSKSDKIFEMHIIRIEVNVKTL